MAAIFPLPTSLTALAKFPYAEAGSKASRSSHHLPLNLPGNFQTAKALRQLLTLLAILRVHLHSIASDSHMPNIIIFNTPSHLPLSQKYF